MGLNKSKVQNTGDPQVQILNQLQLHEEYHSDHDIKLNIIIVLVSIQLIITLYRIYNENAKKRALKAAKSIANIANA